MIRKSEHECGKFSAPKALRLAHVKNSAARVYEPFLMRDPCSCGRSFRRIYCLCRRTADMPIPRAVNAFSCRTEDAPAETRLRSDYRIKIGRSKHAHFDESESAAEGNAEQFSAEIKIMESSKNRISAAA